MLSRVRGSKSSWRVLGEGVGDGQVTKNDMRRSWSLGPKRRRRKRSLIKWVVPSAVYQGSGRDKRLYF